MEPTWGSETSSVNLIRTPCKNPGTKKYRCFKHITKTELQRATFSHPIKMPTKTALVLNPGSCGENPVTNQHGVTENSAQLRGKDISSKALCTDLGVT